MSLLDRILEFFKTSRSYKIMIVAWTLAALFFALLALLFYSMAGYMPVAPKALNAATICLIGASINYFILWIDRKYKEFVAKKRKN